MNKGLTPAMEDYLEAIAVAKEENDVVRVRDIAEALGVKSSSVNAALKVLAEKGMVRHPRYGYVDITPKGARSAQYVQEKHDMIFDFLTGVLGIKEQQASEEACRMEHAISPTTLERLTKFISFARTGLDEQRSQWLKSFRHYMRTGQRLECEDCRKLAERED